MSNFTTCGKCSWYSRSLLRCKKGKANPRTLKGTKEAIRAIDPSYICCFSKWKVKAVVQLMKEKETK